MIRGIWSDITPKVKHSDGWHFAFYVEAPSEREDGEWYSAFLFRNDERTQFGIQEWRGELVHQRRMRHMAMQVLTRPEFRKSLLSEAPELPKWWKKR